MLSRSTVTTGFEVLGCLLVAASAGLGFLLPWRGPVAVAVAGLVLLGQSALIQLRAPKPPPQGVDAA